MNSALQKKIAEISHEMGFPSHFIFECIEEEWILPCDEDDGIFDQEDLARIRLIQELREDFGVNEEGIPIILHLIDELHFYRNLFKDIQER